MDGIHSVAVNSEGLVQESNASYSAQSGGERSLLAGNIPYGEPAPNISLSANLTFVLKEKVKASESVLALIRQILQSDSTIKSYTRDEFLAMVDAKLPTPKEAISTFTLTSPTNGDSSDQSNLRTQEDEGPTLSRTRARRLGRGDSATYTIINNTHPIIETFIFGRPFRAKIISSINMTLIDGKIDTDSNYTVVSTLLMSYSGPTWIPLHSLSKDLGSNYSNASNYSGVITMYVPIRYGDSRLNFALLVDANVSVASSHYLEVIGNQVTFGKKIRVTTSCKSEITVDAGNIRGTATLSGSMSNFEAYEDTLVIPINNTLYVRDLVTSVVLPYSYRTYQAFQTYGCQQFTGFKGKKGWVATAITGWCSWSTNEDRITEITTPLKGRIISNNQIPL